MSTQTAEAGTEPVDGAGAANPFGTSVLAVGGVVFAVLMALSDRYGFQRDELYFLDCARHLQASYVDQGAVGPLLAWASLKLFGVSMPGLRLWSSLAAAGTVIIAGLTAREFGGGKRAQLLAAAGAGVMPALLASAHVANTTSYVILACAGLALVVARAGRTGDARWWLAGGVITGIGWDDNHLVGILAAAITVCALVLPGGRPMVLNRWFGLGAVIAAIIVSPDLWWQATHGWATLAMTHALNSENGGPLNIVAWIVGQLGIACIAAVWVWAAGLRFLWRSSDRHLWRALAMAYVLLFVVYAVTTGKQSYYLAGNYVYLLAAGFVSLDRWLHARRSRLYRLLTAMTVTTALSAVAVLPILPESDIAWTYNVSSVEGETVGWPQVVQAVRGAWFSLPASQRAQAVIYADDYSEAGAINELGRGTGLPTAVGGQNNDWWWGPGNPRATTVVVIVPGGSTAGADAAQLRQYFTGVQAAATLSNPYGVHNIEWHGHVFVCTGPRHPWGQMWPRLRHYE